MFYYYTKLAFGMQARSLAAFWLQSLNVRFIAQIRFCSSFGCSDYRFKCGLSADREISHVWLAPQCQSRNNKTWLLRVRSLLAATGMLPQNADPNDPIRCLANFHVARSVMYQKTVHELQKKD